MKCSSVNNKSCNCKHLYSIISITTFKTDFWRWGLISKLTEGHFVQCWRTRFIIYILGCLSFNFLFISKFWLFIVFLVVHHIHIYLVVYCKILVLKLSLDWLVRRQWWRSVGILWWWFGKKKTKIKKWEEMNTNGKRIGNSRSEVGIYFDLNNVNNMVLGVTKLQIYDILYNK